jgi:rhamnogalacturonan endolyase
MRFAFLLFCLMLFFLTLNNAHAQYQVETLDRGLVAMERSSNGKIYVGWRLLNTDPEDIAFHVYRDDVRITEAAIDTSTNLVDADGSTSSVYTVRAVVDGQEQEASAPATVRTKAYHSIPLQRDLNYGGNHVGVGDLDGDGIYDFVVKRGSQDIDPSQGTVATNTFKLEGYKSDGTFLWRVDLGWNIRQGIWYSPVLVYDLDGDGKAEVIAKIGEVDEDLNGDGKTDYRSGSEKRVLSGPEYFVIIDGQTGDILARDNWIERGSVSSWGDSYGNRVNRNMMTVAYLDGQRPSLIILRGTYTKMYADAWNWRDGQLTKLWRWYLPSGGGGFHNLRTGDIDGDGKDELVNGSIAIDDDGTEMWKTGEGHGDRMHMTDIDPERPGLEVWYVQEAPSVNGIHLTDAQDGNVIWGISKSIATGDVGRGLAADIDPRYKGLECWASQGDLYNCRGMRIGAKPSSCNMAIWWDGDLLRELLDGTSIEKYNSKRLLSASGSTGSRNAPMGYGDIFGDWREEVWYIANNNELRIYSTDIPTDRRLTTLMHDKDYRISVACEMVGYMQATQPSFYVGMDMDQDPSETPPYEPTGLSGSAGQDSVLLKWKANSESDMAGYFIYRAEASNGAYEKLNSTPVSETYFIDRTVVNEVTYFYVISAVDVDGNESRYSNEINAMPTSIPALPVGLSAAIDVDRVQLFWTENPEKDILGYNVYRSTAVDAAGDKLNSEPIADTTFTDNNVSQGATYFYTITAIDNDANESLASKLFTAVPDIPLVLQAEDAVLTDGIRFRNHTSGYNGTGFVDFIDETGELLFSHINGRDGGRHRLIYRYSQRTSNDFFIGIVYINGVRKTIRSYDTGGTSKWRVDTLAVDLQSGSHNTLLFKSPQGDWGNLDEIIIEPADYSPVAANQSTMPLTYALHQNYPNPFNPETTIRFDVPQAGDVSLQIYNVTGQVIRTLVDDNMPAGQHAVIWDSRNDVGVPIATGIYFYKMVSDHFTEIKKMSCLR